MSVRLKNPLLLCTDTLGNSVGISYPNKIYYHYSCLPQLWCASFEHIVHCAVQDSFVVSCKIIN